jgi:hypothetical protein
MKKILCLFGALTLLLSSCSSDDSPSSSDSVLLKKVVLTSSEGKTTVNYKYDGNKIVSVIDDSGEVNLYYTYTGDVITKIEFKLPNGSTEQVNTFSYGTDGKLATFVRVEFDEDDFKGYKEVYTYNANGTISVKAYNGDDKTQTNATGTSTITFVSGDVSEVTSTNSPNRKYVYDDKNNSAKNVLGLDKISFVDGEGTGVFHNEVTETTDGKVSATYNYTYNSVGYPEKSSDKIDGFSYTSEYFY